MKFPDFKKIRIDRIKNLYQLYEIEVDVLRLDLIHPHISGNKWFKLQEYLREAQQLNKTTIATFGGAFSNHIIATAAACKLAGLNAIGIIRGEKAKDLSYTLQQAQDFGMQLYFISREAYKNKELPAELIDNDLLLIGEGGYGFQGCIGAGSILNHFSQENYDFIACAVGTGTTLAGIVNASPLHHKVIGISVLKNAVSLQQEINCLLPEGLQDQFELNHQFHCGGYAKFNLELIEFMNWWHQQTGIPTDFVYTGKLFYAIHQLITSHYFQKGSRLLLIHSGGLQGNISLPKDTLIFS
jgi:1-aminocyclopropane-1-carboxylate deaminase